MKKLIIIIVVLAVLLLFVGMNLENKCSIRFWFAQGAQIQNVPVFFTVFAAYFLGLLSALPFAISIKLKKAKQKGGKAAAGNGSEAEDTPAQDAQTEEPKPGDLVGSGE
jgi:uncharacterized membrane protein YciS (DUF1049 family)